jgi:hypothetical protein
VYDHFSTVFEFASGERAFTTTRHQRGCSNESHALVMGTRGVADLKKGVITGEQPWEKRQGPRVDTHQLEQNAFLAALRAGEVINNGHYMANSTLMAIMSRESAYTGQSLKWEEMLHSEAHLIPTGYTWDAQPPQSEIAVPGRTEFA